MTNWFSDHPGYTIVGHTILVATTTWLVSSFVIDENKINLYKAQAENASAISEQYKAKVSVLELELQRIRGENERYLSWLTQDPRTIPALENKVKALESQLASRSDNAEDPTSLEHETEKGIPDSLPYEFEGVFSKGESFIDPKTKATLGISHIKADYTATGVLYLPGGKSIDLQDIKPGTTWVFEDVQGTYKMTIESINWLNDTLKASVVKTTNHNHNNQMQTTPKDGAPD